MTVHGFTRRRLADIFPVSSLLIGLNIDTRLLIGQLFRENRFLFAGGVGGGQHTPPPTLFMVKLLPIRVPPVPVEVRRDPVSFYLSKLILIRKTKFLNRVLVYVAPNGS